MRTEAVSNQKPQQASASIARGRHPAGHDAGPGGAMQAFVDASPRMVAQRNAIQSLSLTAPIAQLTRYEMAVDGQRAVYDNTGQEMVFLEPGGGGEGAPVHLSKNIDRKKDDFLKINGASDFANIAKADTKGKSDPHLTLTSGLMTAALLDSPLRKILVYCNRFEMDPHFAVGGLAQNKLMANQVIEGFKRALQFTQLSTFDNLRFDYSPNKKNGVSFEEVRVLHQTVHRSLARMQEPTKEEMSDRYWKKPVPYADVNFQALYDSSGVGAAALVQRWQPWDESNVSKHKGKQVAIGDFYLSNITDIQKAIDIIDTLRILATDFYSRTSEVAKKDNYQAETGQPTLEVIPVEIRERLNLKTEKEKQELRRQEEELAQKELLRKKLERESLEKERAEKEELEKGRREKARLEKSELLTHPQEGTSSNKVDGGTSRQRNNRTDKTTSPTKSNMDTSSSVELVKQGAESDWGGIGRLAFLTLVLLGGSMILWLLLANQ